MLTGTLPNLTREQAKERIEAAGGKVTGLGVEEDRLRGGRRGPGQRSSPRRRTLGTEVLDEDGLLALLDGAAG